MSSPVPAWLADDSKWGPAPKADRIDVHHHFIPEPYIKVIEDAGGDPSGWPMPTWSPESSLALMDRIGIKTAVLSLTAPGAALLTGEASARLARQANEGAAAVRDRDPERFGFFVALPNVLDTAAALEEIRYGLDELRADGVCLFTRYGDGNAYLGHPDIEPIWAELHRRRIVVFVHPTHPVDTNLVNPGLPQPMFDYPHETGRTAMDMITRGVRAKYTDCKVILSHAGGTLPWLVNRVALTVHGMDSFLGGKVRSYDEIMKDFRSFHFDLALSSTEVVVQLLRQMVPTEHILYGSDFPYATPPSFATWSAELDATEMSQEAREKIHFGNAMDLFPRLDTISRKSDT